MNFALKAGPQVLHRHMIVFPSIFYEIIAEFLHALPSLITHVTAAIKLQKQFCTTVMPCNLHLQSTRLVFFAREIWYHCGQHFYQIVFTFLWAEQNADSLTHTSFRAHIQSHARTVRLLYTHLRSSQWKCVKRTFYYKHTLYVSLSPAFFTNRTKCI